MAQTVESVATAPTYRDELDELRCHDNEWLRAERTRVVVEQRRLKVREVAITKVLDERDALDPVPDGSVSTRTAKATIDVARALDSVPAIAQVAHDGELSFEQLEQVVRLATSDTDQEWARRA